MQTVPLETASLALFQNDSTYLNFSLWDGHLPNIAFNV